MEGRKKEREREGEEEEELTRDKVEGVVEAAEN